MFEARIDDVNVLKSSMKTVSNLISEGLLQIQEDGIRLVAADPAMVALVDLRLEEGSFETYEVDEEDKIGLNLENLYSILRRANSDDSVTLEVDEEQADFHITMEGASTRNFSLPILNLSEDDIPSVDDLDQFTATVDMESSLFSDAIGDAMVVGDSVVFESDGDSLEIVAEGDQSTVDFRVDEESPGVVEIDGADARSMFALEYLNKMSGAKSISENTRLRIGEDFPMRVEFTAPENASLSFILAPRIEED